MSDLSWMKKLIIGGEMIIDYVDIGLSCKTFFVLGMLHPFINLSQIAESQKLSKSPALRSNQSPITKVETDPEPSVVVEPDVLDELESEVVTELVTLQEKTSQSTEVEEPLIEIFVDLPAEPTMDLLPSSSATRVTLSLRSRDTYDPLDIFLQQAGSQEIKFLIVQSTIVSVFSGDDLHRHAACIFLELPLTADSLSRSPVPPIPP